MVRRGPLPVPNSERLHPHTSRQLDTPAAAPKIEAPPVDPNWHPQAQVWYLGLDDTPQAGEYTRADWGHAHTAAAIMSGCFWTGDYRTAAAVLETAGQRLMTTRPARLAARLDIDDDSEPGDVIDLPTNDQLRARTFAAPG